MNGGFDDAAKKYGWTFPTVLTPTNWAYMQAAYPNVATLGNIQCENCHGPGSQHVFTPAGGLGNTNFISKTLDSGACNQCHDAPTHHVKGAEWYNSRHAVAVEETEASCSRCHTAQGFANYTAGAPATATPYEVITCVACHEPHSAANPHQLRTSAPVTLMDKKTTITTNTAGLGIMCMNCHMSRRDATNYVEITAGSSRFGPHHGPQTDMLVGANAVNYGKVIASSAHQMWSWVTLRHLPHAGRSLLPMPRLLMPAATPSAVSWDSGTNTVQLTDACVQCHGPISSIQLRTAGL